ncbi:MAG TPA: hypothetical protein PKE49_02105 [Leptospiraceae bacterium]|nr:hypothetical protein [Leptospirales bacterium]HMU85226.1 hypothetical protein [Leptospiraceae bacterium]HMX55283.1 hypothetical protein [Leptospiraceae bacterium]HMY47867.1 hypothetical protein [Leptospiraceae bacterium]HNE21912.1 hypothetical protein [Leptospiraceae bacterium]
MKPEINDLTLVCQAFHKNRVRFIVIGAHACAMHGHIRATADVDVLIQDQDENIEKAISAIHELYPHLAEPLTVDDFRESIVIKILDEPELDVSLSAWSVTFDQASKHTEVIVLDGIEIPFMGLADLIQSKSTERDQDKWDVSVLKEIQKKRK